MRAAVTYLDARGRSWQEGVATVVNGRVQIIAGQAEAGMPRLDGVVTGGFTDSHVHLQLIDAAALAESALGRVIDLGGNPTVLSDVHNSSAPGGGTPKRGDLDRIRAVLEELRTTDGLEIGFAGAFLTPPGGYPSDRSWAPEGSVREITTYQDAATATAEMSQAGATVIKVASNSAAGPVFSDEMFAAIVDLASTHGSMSVIAHAEGPGEAQRATRLRARLLAHAPFTERLTDAELHAMHGNVAWISTLAIHDGEAYDVAVDNVRRFRALGGNILYGTDMGNGPTPAALSPREISALREAGIDGASLLRSLVPVDPLAPGSRLNLYPGASPETADPLHARPLTPADLEA